jgi:membrane-associated phospholipid phosphatase
MLCNNYITMTLRFLGTSCLVLLGACLVTYALVVTGLDWEYFLYTYNSATRPVLFLADGLGFLIPLALPLGVYLYGRRQKSQRLRGLALALASSVFVGFLLSTIIKVFTGRISPPHHGPFDVDISGAFQFGFMEHHIIGGWPSSHATVMFALAMCVWILFPQAQRFRVTLFISAFFVAIGVTFGFHWLSEFIAGACLGTVIGYAVGRMFMSRKVPM